MKNMIKRVYSQRGATMIEYAIIVSLIALVSIGVITALGGKVETIFKAISDALVTTSA